MLAVLAFTLFSSGACDTEPEPSPGGERPAPVSVRLSPDAVRSAGIQVAPVGTAAVSPVVSLTGTLAATPWTSQEQAVMSDAATADARLRLAQANFERLSRLSAQGVVARQDLDSARAERDQARAAAAAADARLANMGLSRPAAETESRSKIWGLGTLAEVDLPRVHVGESAVVTTDAFPGRRFAGQVMAVSRSADPDTRNFTVRIAVEDPSHLLHPQMLANFAVSVPASPALSIPASAVLLEGDGSYVYVEQSPGLFARQRIRTGAPGRDMVAVTEGLTAGQRVVIAGAQILESERLKSSLKPADTD